MESNQMLLYSKNLVVIFTLVTYVLHFGNSIFEEETSEMPWRQNQVNFTGRDGHHYIWPFKNQHVRIDGDIYLGGLMMVHSRSDEKVCGKVMPQGGIQALEAMLYTIDVVNKQNFIGRDIKLGAYIKDDCDRDTYGLDQAVDFIKGSPKISSGQAKQCRKAEDGIPLISGVVGAPSSVTSSHVASLLKLFDIPQISFFSTALQLSDKNRFPFFLRTIPSDKFQVKVILDIITAFNWTYVSIIYEDSKYGREAFEEMHIHFRKNGICLAVVETLPRDSRVAKIEDYYEKIERLNKHQSSFEGLGATGVVIFGSDQEVGDFMQAVKNRNSTEKFSWIGSDGWGARPTVYTKDIEGDTDRRVEVEGAVTVQPLAQSIVGFEEYFLNLTPSNNHRNPWFTEFWEDYFECWLWNATMTPYNGKDTYPDSKRCGNNLKIRATDRKFNVEPQLQFVSDAVMAFAYAFKNLVIEKCDDSDSRRSCSEKIAANGVDLLRELQKINFTGLTGMMFRFTAKADGPPRYRVLNFQKVSDPDTYDWLEVGRFEKNKLALNTSILKFRGGYRTPPVSACQPECPFDHKLQINPGECRCWVCIPCGQYFIVSANKEQCVECKQGEKPSADRTVCEVIRLEYLTYGHPIAIAALAVATLGLISTGLIMLVFIKHKETAVVKASGRELSFLLLLGIFFCYLMTFILCARPNVVLCGLQKFGVPSSFSICYSALLIKTNRIERIFRAGRKTIKRPKFISPLSQIVMFGIVMAVQFVILGVWLFMKPPKAIHHYPSRDKHQLVCDSLIGSLYMIGLIHPIFVIIICTLYAFLTRNIPESFNESKHIGFSMYSTCVIWLGFVPCYFSTAAFIHIRIATLCFSISLSATVALSCLFGPKLYIILWHPELNVRQSMMTTKSAASMRQGSVTRGVASGVDVTANHYASNHLTPNKTAQNCNTMTVDISTQSDVEYELRMTTLNGGGSDENCDNSPEESVPMLNKSNSQMRPRLSDSVTQTSMYSLKSLFGLEIPQGARNRKVYLLSENTDEILL